MLSENIREMRREFQKVLLDAGECVQISVLSMQSFVLALSIYEDAARDMEELIAPQSLPVRQHQSGSTVLSFPTQSSKRPQLVVIQGDGGDVA